jgi:hypothetical protein
LATNSLSVTKTKINYTPQTFDNIAISKFTEHWGVLIEYKNEMGERLASYLYEALSERGKLTAYRLMMTRKELEKKHSGFNVIKLFSVLIIMNI